MILEETPEKVMLQVTIDLGFIKESENDLTLTGLEASPRQNATNLELVFPKGAATRQVMLKHAKTLIYCLKPLLI